jgi:indolepyruvate ferredoxin oxidoreductase beta subunit
MSLNMVLLGALIQTGALPLSAECVKEAVRQTTKASFQEVNLTAFELGFEAARKET